MFEDLGSSTHYLLCFQFQRRHTHVFKSSLRDCRYRVTSRDILPPKHSMLQMDCMPKLCSDKSFFELIKKLRVFCYVLAITILAIFDLIKMSHRSSHTASSAAQELENFKTIILTSLFEASGELYLEWRPGNAVLRHGTLRLFNKCQSRDVPPAGANLCLKSPDVA